MELAPGSRGDEIVGAPRPAKNIVWLASYPKSGNTWLRVFLTNLLGDHREPADINELDVVTIASSRRAFDAAVGLEAGDLTADEAERLRPRVYEAWAAASPEAVQFHKIHDAYGYTASDEPLISVAATRGAVYLVRNPLDVCASYAHHNGVTAAVAAAALCDPGHALSDNPRRLHRQLGQRLSTWGDHVRSWMRAVEIPVHLVRYEDMKARPLETFTAVVRFAGLPHDRAAIQRAIDLSTFERLREQEAAHGFRERSLRAESFFRRGEVGSWREALTDDQVERIVACNGDVMRELGYAIEQV